MVWSIGIEEPDASVTGTMNGQNIQSLACMAAEEVTGRTWSMTCGARIIHRGGLSRVNDVEHIMDRVKSLA